MDGGAWLRLQRAGMMSTIRVVHAVVASAIIHDFGASERQYSALAAYGYGLEGCCAGLEAVGPRAARGYRSGLAWFKAWSLRMQHDRHGAVPQSWWRGRAEERRGLGDGALRLTAHVRLKKKTCWSWSRARVNVVGW